MKTLYDKLKPEYKNKLESNKFSYESSVKAIEDTLKANHSWYSLSMHDISNILVFTDVTLYSITSSDLMFGEMFFEKD